MKPILLLTLALTGCSTTVYGPNGKPQMRTYADATALTFTGPGTSLSAQRLSHSAPTRAALNGATAAITAAGTAAVTRGLR